MAKKFVLTDEKFTPIFTENGELRIGREGRYEVLPINQLKPREGQPRKSFPEEEINELAASIKKNGILQPILINTDNYIIAGERRYRAARIAGLEKVPVIIKDVDDRSVAIFALVENVQRADLTPIEEAEAYRALIAEYKLTHEEVSKLIGKSRSAITNALRLLELNIEVIGQLKSGGLNAGHAKILAGLSKEEQGRVVKEVVERKLNVRESERLVKMVKEGGQGNSLVSDTKIADLQSRFENYASHVKLQSMGQGRLRLTLDFDSIRDIERLVKVLGN